ncbi:hypothetical protein E3N88_30513 [Mikania micrantha]|uniref:BED-type domain-containing protein n=1 Tax=Mikania micrantha TaxID=192012 RepID=A0A5N6MMR9_9ASTR|nr:hypothetical protein E3N88_30513 [Mikania micrantha]
MDSQHLSSDDNEDPSNNQNNAPKRQGKKRKNTSLSWQHFEEFFDEDGLRKGKCNYCKREICADPTKNGTSALGKHLKRCPENPERLKDQTTMFMKENDDGQGTLKTWKFDPQKVMDIIHNLEDMFTKNSHLQDFKKMLSMMKNKFEKYFEDTNKTNMLFDFAVILDPRFKLEIIHFGCKRTVDLIKLSKKDMTEEEYQKKVDELVDDVKSKMQILVSEYEILYQTGASTLVRKECDSVPSRQGKNSWMTKFEQYRGVGVQSFGKKTELERYLKDEIEEKTDNFDILQWWKTNSTRYPTLSKITKDIFEKIESMGME